MARSKNRKKKNTATQAKACTDRPTPTVENIRQLLTKGDVSGARIAAETALAANPHDPALLNLCGIAAAQAGDQTVAASLFETALAFDPSDLDTRMNLANVLSALGDLSGADSAYSRVITADPNHRDAYFNRALARQAMGRLSDAKDSLDRAIALRRDWPSALINRATLLQELGRVDAAKADLDHALSLDPGSIDARYNLGVLWQEIDNQTDAIEAYRMVLSRQSDHTGARMNMAMALYHSGDTDAALTELERACTAAPDFDKAHVNRADLLRRSGDVMGALAAARGYLKRHPGNPSMTAFLAIAEKAAGNTDAANAVLALRTSIKPFAVDWPAFGADPAAIQARLADYVLTHPSLHDSPIRHATRTGGHTGNLMIDPGGPLIPFEQAIRRAVDDYQAHNTIEPDHPFMAADKPGATGLHVWGVAMREAGHQVSHNHPSAWLSGVYYVQTPCVGDGLGSDDIIINSQTTDTNAFAGWIEFGRPPDDFVSAEASAVRLIKPRAGTMIVFPSFLYHRTLPHAGTDLRISMAFDVYAIA